MLVLWFIDLNDCSFIVLRKVRLNYVWFYGIFQSSTCLSVTLCSWIFVYKNFSSNISTSKRLLPWWLFSFRLLLLKYRFSNFPTKTFWIKNIIAQINQCLRWDVILLFHGLYLEAHTKLDHGHLKLSFMTRYIPLDLSEWFVM